jgi:hypothetical protein
VYIYTCKRIFCDIYTRCLTLIHYRKESLHTGHNAKTRVGRIQCVRCGYFGDSFVKILWCINLYISSSNRVEIAITQDNLCIDQSCLSDRQHKNIKRYGETIRAVVTCKRK